MADSKTPDRSPAEQAFLDRLGQDILAARTAAGLSQHALGDQLFGWQRDAMSKIETGKNSISLYDYLTIMHYLREFVASDHPALALVDLMLKRRSSRPRLVQD